LIIIDECVFQLDLLIIVNFKFKKLNKYIQSNGYIYAPVRAWENIQQAERFSKNTGRKIILRLNFPSNSDKLEGHFDQARVLMHDYKLDSI